MNTQDQNDRRKRIEEGFCQAERKAAGKAPFRKGYRHHFPVMGIALMGGLLLFSKGLPGYAAGWQQDGQGWWYASNASGSTWYANGWKWIEGEDGIARQYYFGRDGYLYTDTTTPDGYTVNEDGAWTVDGVVQEKRLQDTGENAAQEISEDGPLSETETDSSDTGDSGSSTNANTGNNGSSNATDMGNSGSSTTSDTGNRGSSNANDNNDAAAPDADHNGSNSIQADTNPVPEPENASQDNAEGNPDIHIGSDPGTERSDAPTVPTAGPGGGSAQNTRGNTPSEQESQSRTETKSGLDSWEDSVHYFYGERTEAGKALPKSEPTELVTFARQYVNVLPYVYAGTSLESGTDCSGFVYAVFQHFGMTVPRSSAGLYSASTPITADELKPGDLVFYFKEGASTPHHVGIYTGNGSVVHNTQTGDYVREMDACYYPRYAFGRIIK